MEKRVQTGMCAFSPSLLKQRFSQVAYFLKTGYWMDGERVNPDVADENFENHLKVYQFLQQLAVGKEVLDSGCGTGYGSDHLAQVANSVVGVDLSASAIRWARKRYPQGNYMEMDVQEFTFDDSSFDLIVSNENFEHLPDQAKHVRELARVLRPGGLCFVASPNPWMFVGEANPFHTKENTYDELHEHFGQCFGKVVVVANQSEPPTPEGRTMKLQRWAGGPEADPLPAGLDTTWMHNTHSYFCFLSEPFK